MGTTIDNCRTCKHAFTTGKDVWYCKKSLADKDDCGGYEMTEEGMSIDEAIKRLRQWLKNGSNGLTDTRLGYIEGWFHKSDEEAYMTAIDTMRKYKKIEQILEDRESDGGAFEMSESYWLKMIKEVVKDGRN